ncbi:hypothetical protein J6590_017587 [Homalodisca vitripennis]|nr:hypothetical protein J6590_017587 [Homalodisca vitripennis]
MATTPDPPQRRDARKNINLHYHDKPVTAMKHPNYQQGKITVSSARANRGKRDADQVTQGTIVSHACREECRNGTMPGHYVGGG